MTALHDNGVMCVPFDSVPPVKAPHGHGMRPLVDARPGEGNLAEWGHCVGGLDVLPGFLARVHLHPEEDVTVLVTSSGPLGALTLSGLQLEHRTWQKPGDLVAIPRRITHTVLNPNLGPDDEDTIRAYEVRTSQSVLDGNHLLPDLQPLAAAVAVRILSDIHGVEVVRAFYERTVAAGRDPGWKPDSASGISVPRLS